MRDDDWDYSWPPRWGEVFPDATRYPLAGSNHMPTVLAWIKHSPALKHVSANELKAWAQFIWGLDRLASQMEHTLLGEKWSEERHNSTILGKLSPDKLRKHNANAIRWQCLQDCRRARQAIFVGDWLTAVQASMAAGDGSVGVEAAIGSSQKLSRHKASVTGDAVAERRRLAEICAEEARKMYAANTALSKSDVARRLHDTHAKGGSYPSWRAIMGWISSPPKKVCKRGSSAD